MDDEADRLSSIASSHVVVGIVSMLQVEARWLGRPAISVQPGALVPSDLVGLHRIPVVHDARTLTRTITDALDNPGTLPAPPILSIPRWSRFLHADPNH